MSSRRQEKRLALVSLVIAIIMLYAFIKSLLRFLNYY